MDLKILRAVTSFALAAALVPVAPLSAGANESTQPRPPIEKLLTAGDYAEGEAIALVRADGDSGAAGAGETLAEVDADAVELAAKDAAETESALDDVALLRVQSAPADAYAVKHVVDPTRTTEQILRDLYKNPDVIAAEPNYMMDTAAAFGSDARTSDSTVATQQSPATLTTGESSDLAAPGAFADNPNDLTDQQWDLSASTADYTTPRSPSASYSVNVPGWQQGRTSTSAPANASGTVCIMDTGLDVNHPDLKNVVFTFSKSQQEKYGCGPHGMNASGVGEAGDVTDYDGHGTHVAGIVAAQWNGFGVSGVANGVNIFSVRTFSESGSVDQKSTVKGFKFLVDVAQEINLKAVNCSWGNIRAEFILTVMANELGKKGVNTVFASGNRALDLDENIDSGGQVNSVYALVVNAAQPDGAMTDFSCWGQMSTDVFAPGAEIISTVPTSVTASGVYTDNTRFYPEATAQANLLYGIDRFDAESSGVRFFDKNPALDSSAKEIGSRTTEVGFDDKGAMAFKVRSLAKSESFLGGYRKAENGSVFLAIPVASPAAAKWVALRNAVSDSNKFAGGIASITCETKDGGKPVQVDNFCIDAMAKGLTAASSGSVYWSQWMPKSLDVEGYVNASNEAHRKYLEDPASLDFQTQAVTYKYKDPGEVSGLYGWADGGKTYIIVEVGLGATESDPAVDDSTTLYLDNVAVGNGGSFTGAYEVMAGTSMATPCVTGCLAVISKDEPASSALSPEQLELEARERAAKLLAAVDYDDDLSKLCSTGGRVNLRGQSTFAKKAPIVARAVCEGGKLSISGYFFGKTGTLSIDDVEAATESWSDESITATVGDLANGTHVAEVVNADGAVARVLFSFSSDAASGRPLYERSHSLPFSLEEYAGNGTDRLYGAMVACDGKLYAMSADMGRNRPQDMWSYDTATDEWAHVALPADYDKGQDLYPGRLAAAKGKVYLYGTVNDESSGDALWSYDASAGEWSRVHVADLPSSGCICALGDQLFIIDEYNYGTAEDSSAQESSASPALAAQASESGGKQERGFFRIIDVEKGKLAPVKGDIPGLVAGDGQNEENYNLLLSRAVASNEKLYCYVHSNRQKIPGTLIRATYDADTQSMAVEDLGDALKAAIGDDLGSYVDQQTAETLVDHFTIAGLPDGLAIIGSDKAGADTHVIKDSGTTAETYARTSCYHHPTNPLAAYSDGYLYATANNATEPDVMYFRSTYYGNAEQKADPSADSGDRQKATGASTFAKAANGAAKATTTSAKSATPKTGDSLPVAAAGLVAAIALVCLAAAWAARRWHRS